MQTRNLCNKNVGFQFHSDRSVIFRNCLYLNNESFASPAWGGANHAHVVGFHDEILKSMENTSTRRRDTSMDTTLVNRFASHTGMSIDIQMTYKLKEFKTFKFSGLNLGFNGATTILNSDTHPVQSS